MAEESDLDASSLPIEEDITDFSDDNNLDCEIRTRILPNWRVESRRWKRSSTQQALITEVVAKELEKKFPAPKDIVRLPPVAKAPSTISYADRVKSGTTTERSKSVIKNKVTKKYITTVKPKEEASSSAETRKMVQAKLDIRTLKIGVKQVRNIRNGGIIIETDTETDLDKLIQEFKLQDDLTKNFTIDKPALKKPQIICFDVAQDTSGDKILEDLHSQFSEIGHENEDFHIKHHFNSKRGVNWIFEVNPSLFSKGILATNLDVLQSFLEKYHLFKTFICGDFNAKSRVWGKRNVDNRGTQLLAFCNAMKLTIENSPSSLPTFDCRRCQSGIDLLLTKNIDKGISMEVSDDMSNSDHNLLHFSWSMDQLPPPERIHINISQTNWLSVKSTIFNIIRAHSSSGFSDVNGLISTIQTEITARLCTTSKNRRSSKQANGDQTSGNHNRIHLIKYQENNPKV
ncbi:uncharacterized protein CDAR_391111 [Caerostris darwini]|uniref:Endonuclease/exonuclease/phosphatase domain-containing protein n=1 Tax=Caerostris darwini TaxID=1538125 RepID=A0AAV4UAK1_9ARAC|nr:uncharacterized protein CDAR_391111 [Caerostris darwini]